jgi:hypothetical protein
MSLVNTNPNPPQRYRPRGKKREWIRHFIHLVEPKKYKLCWGCRRIVKKDEKYITAMGDIFHGRVGMGCMCRECFLEFIHEYDKKLLKKQYVKKVESIQVARKV